MAEKRFILELGGLSFSFELSVRSSVATACASTAELHRRGPVFHAHIVNANGELGRQVAWDAKLDSLREFDDRELVRIRLLEIAATPLKFRVFHAALLLAAGGAACYIGGVSVSMANGFAASLLAVCTLALFDLHALLSSEQLRWLPSCSVAVPSPLLILEAVITVVVVAFASQVPSAAARGLLLTLPSSFASVLRILLLHCGRRQAARLHALATMPAAQRNPSATANGAASSLDLRYRIAARVLLVGLAAVAVYAVGSLAVVSNDGDGAAPCAALANAVSSVDASTAVDGSSGRPYVASPVTSALSTPATPLAVATLAAIRQLKRGGNSSITILPACNTTTGEAANIASATDAVSTHIQLLLNFANLAMAIWLGLLLAFEPAPGRASRPPIEARGHSAVVKMLLKLCRDEPDVVACLASIGAAIVLLLLPSTMDNMVNAISLLALAWPFQDAVSAIVYPQAVRRAALFHRSTVLLLAAGRTVVALIVAALVRVCYWSLGVDMDFASVVAALALAPQMWPW